MDVTGITRDDTAKDWGKLKRTQHPAHRQVAIRLAKTFFVASHRVDH